MTADRSARSLWREAPWTINAYAALEAITILFSFATSSIEPEREVARSSPGSLIFWAIVASVLIYWLLRRSRATRIFLVVWNSLALLAAFDWLGDPPKGYVVAAVWVAIIVCALVLLMHPATRSWCDRRLKLTDPDRLSQGGTTQV